MESIAKLFYSYSHKDAEFRNGMEEALAMLRRNGLLKEWFDRNIDAGQKITDKILASLDESDIIVFLLSPSFLNSDACIEEWNYAKTLANAKSKVLISVIIRDCAWEDFDDARQYKALPNDGKPISRAIDKDTAWKEVYQGIKEVIEGLKSTFTPKHDALKDINTLEFYSQSKNVVVLNDLFVFPELVAEKNELDEKRRNFRIKNVKEIVALKHCLIRGDELSGKSKLGVHIYNELLEQGKAVLLVDLDLIKMRKADIKVLHETFRTSLSGDFDRWCDQSDITIIFDNLTSSGNCLDFIDIAFNKFANVILLTSSDNYTSYFRDEVRVAKFEVLKICTFTHHKQEHLIKNWLNLRSNKSEEEVDHGLIDKVEREINAIIINDKVIPRYPFYILSILQTYEAFMPQNLKITAYGHCYYALILANLIKSGIDQKDESIDACFTFLSKLAYAIYNNDIDSPSLTEESFNEFVAKYKKMHILSDSLLSRMLDKNSILKRFPSGEYGFSFLYTYYFFLGRYIAINYKDNEKLVTHMLEKSHLDTNSLSLIFAIHHAQGVEIVDEILTHTLCLIDNVEPAKLDETETKLFYELMEEVPDRILSDNSVDAEREHERNQRDIEDLKATSELTLQSSESDEKDKITQVDINNFYRAIKNMEILSQILKNKYGSLEKKKVQEIIESIADAGLRMISFFLGNDAVVRDFVKFIEKRVEHDPAAKKHRSLIVKENYIKKLSTTLLFLYSIGIIEKIVNALSKPEIGDILKLTAETKNTPAYDIIAYFFTLDNAVRIDDHLKQELDNLLERYESKEMFFTKRVVSIRTQFYMNTHSITAPMKQALSSALKIDYKP